GRDLIRVDRVELLPGHPGIPEDEGRAANELSVSRIGAIPRARAWQRLDRDAGLEHGGLRELHHSTILAGEGCCASAPPPGILSPGAAGVLQVVGVVGPPSS